MFWSLTKCQILTMEIILQYTYKLIKVNNRINDMGDEKQNKH